MADVMVQQGQPAPHGLSGRVGGFLKSRTKKVEASEVPKAKSAEKKADTPLYRRYATNAAKAFRSKGGSKEGSREGSEAPKDKEDTGSKEAKEEKPTSDAAKDVVEETNAQPKQAEIAEKADVPEIPSSPTLGLVRRLSNRAANVLKPVKTREGAEETSAAAPPISKASLIARQVSSRAGELFTRKHKTNETPAKGSDAKSAATIAEATETKGEATTDQALDQTDAPTTAATEEATAEKPLPSPPTLTRQLSSRVGGLISKAKARGSDADGAKSDGEDAPTSPTRPKLAARISSKVGSFIKSDSAKSPTTAISPKVEEVTEEPVVDIKAEEAPKTEVTDAEDSKAVVDEVPIQTTTGEVPATADGEAKVEEAPAQEVPQEEAGLATRIGRNLNSRFGAYLGSTPTGTEVDAAAASTIEKSADAKEGENTSEVVEEATKDEEGNKTVEGTEAKDDEPTKGGEGTEVQLVEGTAPVADAAPIVEEKVQSPTVPPPTSFPTSSKPKTGRRLSTRVGDIFKSKTAKPAGPPKEADATDAPKAVGATGGDKPAEASSKAIESPEGTTLEVPKEANKTDDEDNTDKPVEGAAGPLVDPVQDAPSPATATTAVPPVSFPARSRKIGRRLSTRVGDMFRGSKGEKALAVPIQDEVAAEGATSAVTADTPVSGEAPKTETEDPNTDVVDGTAATEATAEGDVPKTVEKEGEIKEVPKGGDDAPVSEAVAVEGEGSDPKPTTTTETEKVADPTTPPPSSFANPRATAKKIGRRLSARVGDLFRKEQREAEKAKAEGERVKSADEPKAAEGSGGGVVVADVPAEVIIADGEDKPKVEGGAEAKQDEGIADKDKPTVASSSTEAVENVDQVDAAKGSEGVEKEKEKPLPTKPSKSARAKEVALDAGRQLTIRAAELLKPKPKLDSVEGGAATSKGKEKEKEKAKAKAEVDVAEERKADADGEGAIDPKDEGATSVDAGVPVATTEVSTPASPSGTRTRKVSELGRKLSTAVSELKSKALKGKDKSDEGPPTPRKDEVKFDDKDVVKVEEIAEGVIVANVEKDGEKEAVGEQKEEPVSTAVEGKSEGAPPLPPKPTTESETPEKEGQVSDDANDAKGPKKLTARVTQLLAKAKQKFPGESHPSTSEGEKEKWVEVGGVEATESSANGAEQVSDDAAGSGSGTKTPTDSKRKKRLSLKFRTPLGGQRKKAKAEAEVEKVPDLPPKGEVKEGVKEKDLPELRPEVPPKDEGGKVEEEGKDPEVAAADAVTDPTPKDVDQTGVKVEADLKEGGDENVKAKPAEDISKDID